MHIYNMFSAELKALKIYINNSLAKEWICESQSSADASILFVLRKSDELCLCVDYCELNVIIIKNCYSLLLTSELLDHVDDSTIFSKINLWNVYHKIHIQEDNEWKITFHTWYKHFEYQVVLFDLTNVSAIFQVYINWILCDLVDDFCIVYLDNILVFSKSEKEYYQHLQLIIKCL